MKLAQIADVFAIVGFSFLVWYFASIEHPSPTEYGLLAFSIAGLVADTFFTLQILLSWCIYYNIRLLG